ncbi:cilia- and flagella-associated protein 276 [Excalfactoria chinensis]|uniref:cilia- and flagella-associated protein 276 n=1 Tax=Excalfactoria chinensis TaxID=46218 RepID=UPI003B3A71CB
MAGGGGATPPGPPRPWDRLHATSARCSRDHQASSQPQRAPEPWPRSWVSPKRESVHRIQGRIECPHSAATNGGYSRKENGGYF